MKTKEKLAALRDQLSDLSMRNRSLRLVKLYKKSAFDVAALDGLAEGRGQKTLDALLASSRRATKLLALLSGDEEEQALSDGLKYLHRDVRLVREDRGLEDLALGWPFLTGSFGLDKFVQCPLFLFPCVLDRKASGGTGSWTARVDPSEVQVNRTFFLALAKKTGLRVSEDHIAELQSWAQETRRTLEETRAELGKLGLKVVPVAASALTELPQYTRSEYPSPTPGRFELHPHAVISRFPLADTALLEDYEQLILKVEANAQELSGFAGALLGESRTASPNRAERPKAWWHVTDMDDSQEEVVRLALGGTQLAVEGPPGTGKSQLIVNVIAATLANNPKARVLVVSQKRAALDVVYQRLGEAFQPFVTKVHDATRERKAVFAQIDDDILELQNRTLQPGPDRPTARVAEELDWFASVRDGAAHADYPARAEHSAQPPRAVVAGLKASHTAPDVRQAAALAISALTARTPGTWKESRPDYAQLSEDDLDELVTRGPTWAQAIQDAKAHASVQGAPVADVLGQAAAWKAVHAWAKATSGATWDLASALVGLQAPTEILSAEFRQIERLEALRETAGGHTVSQLALEEDVRWCLAHGGDFFGFLSSRWWGLEDRLRGAFSTDAIPAGSLPWRCEAWLARLAYTKAVQACRFPTFGFAAHTVRRDDVMRTVRQHLELAEHIEAHRSLGVEWPCPTSKAEFQELAARAAWAVEMKRLEDAAAMARRKLSRWIAVPEAAAQNIAAFIEQVERRFNEFVRHDIECRAFKHSGLLKLATKTLPTLDAASLEATLLAGLAERHLRDAEKAHPVLREVTLTSADKRRTQLAQAWSELVAANQVHLGSRLLRRSRHAQSLAAMQSRAAKRRQRWTLRKFVTEYWEKGLSDLKPVWLCSPDAVAALFQMRQNRFDLVIFDEASQCTLESAVTVVYRAKHCLIAGDEQQLPPSRFFSSAADGDGDDEFELPESLLARAKESAVVQRLNWHYRAQFPELIQFSNAGFYNGTLRVAPNPGELPSAVAFHRVAGRWHRTRNEPEADYVVGLLDAVLRDHPTRSVGVITFNRAQAHCIQDAIDARGCKFKERWNEAMERPLEERPFVRNLENVQGDERDIILLSVGYAPATSDGQVAKRFGILSQPGGERRLNVAVSRARQKMEVVCSFDPATQLNVEQSKSEGTRKLKEYLCYAQAAGRRNEPSLPANAIAGAIATSLRKRGFECVTQVGPSACKVDVAVRRPGQPVYAVGVVLDAAAQAWGDDPAATELHRPRFLGRYQWNVLHVPARSWIREQDKVVAAIISRVDGRVSVSPPPLVQPGKQPVRRVASPAPTTRRATPALQTTRTAGRTTPRTPPVPRATPPRPARPAAPAAPAVPTVRPGSKVQYKNLDEDTLKSAVIAGPGCPGLSHDKPLALALMDAEVGEIVTMELATRDVELLVVQVNTPS